MKWALECFINVAKARDCARPDSATAAAVWRLLHSSFSVTFCALFVFNKTCFVLILFSGIFLNIQNRTLRCINRAIIQLYNQLSIS